METEFTEHSVKESHAVWPVSLTALAQHQGHVRVLLLDQCFSPFHGWRSSRDGHTTFVCPSPDGPLGCVYPSALRATLL